MASGEGGIGGVKTLKNIGAPSLSLRLLSIAAFGEGGGRQNAAKDNQWIARGQGEKLPRSPPGGGRQSHGKYIFLNLYKEKFLKF